MEEFCSSGSDWFELILAFELHINKCLEQEKNSFKFISKFCFGLLKQKYNLNFCDARQWQYFHLLIYTNILKKKRECRVKLKQRNKSSLIKSMISISDIV